MNDTEWASFSFYHGTLTGWSKTVGGRKYEVIPTNGREGSWDVLENEEWVGETFDSPGSAKAWVDA